MNIYYSSSLLIIISKSLFRGRRLDWLCCLLILFFLWCLLSFFVFCNILLFFEVIFVISPIVSAATFFSLFFASSCARLSIFGMWLSRDTFLFLLWIFMFCIFFLNLFNWDYLFLVVIIFLRFFLLLFWDFLCIREVENVE